MGNSIDRGVEVLGAGSGTGLMIDGNAAHDAVDVGNPVKFGGKAHNALPAAVDNGDRVNAYFDLNGVLHVYDENGSSAAAGDVAHDGVDSGNPVKVGGRARSSQIAAVANNDRTDFIANLYGEQVIAGYDWVTQANKVEVNNPISEQFTFETIANVSPATTNTTYDYFIDMSGYQYLTIQWVVTSPGADTNTIKLYGTVLDDGTAPGSIAATDWQDITQYGFNISTAASTSPSYVDTNAIVTIIPGFNYKYVHVENVISNGASNDSTHKIIIKKWY